MLGDQVCQSSSLPDVVSGNAYFLVYRQIISPFGGSDNIAAAPQQAADTAAAADGPPHDEHQAGAPVADATSQSVGAPATTDSRTADEAVGGPADASGGSEDLPVPLLQQVFVGRLLQQLQALPPELQQRVAELHQEFAATCLDFTKEQQQALQQVTQRREEVRNLVAVLPCPDPDDQGCFISAAWLDTWANSEGHPDPIDNGPLLCPHGQLGLDKPSSSYRRISSMAWEALVASHQGGPRLTFDQACPHCLRALLSSRISCNDLAGLKDDVLDALAADEASQVELDEGGGFYISKSWLVGFRTRSSMALGRNVQPPTAGILCPHGALAPVSLSGTAKRFVVSAGSWEMLKQLWVGLVLQEVAQRKAKAARAAAQALAAGNVKEPGPGGKGHQEVRAAADAQRAALKQLMQGGVQEVLEPGLRYYLVPNAWLGVWLKHMSAASAKKVANQPLPPPPPPLPEAVRSVLCDCHPDNPGLTVELPVIVNRRGRYA
eukprot:gene4097-4344_t